MTLVRSLKSCAFSPVQISLYLLYPGSPWSRPRCRTNNYYQKCILICL